MKAQKTYSSIVLFKNPILERFTHVHPVVPVLVWTPVVLFFIYRALWVQGLTSAELFVALVMGLFIWTFFEYALHRFIFHFEASHPFAKRLVYLFHGIHHDSPDDPTRLLMPPLGGGLIALVLYGIFSLFLPSGWLEGTFAFFLVGYLIYDYTHFFAHHGNPSNAWTKQVKRNHMNHHFVSPHLLWGVSSPLWDWVFGTFKDSVKSSVGTSSAKAQ